MILNSYFEYVAIHLKALRHRTDAKGNECFFRVSGLSQMEELLQNTNCKDLVLVVEDGYDGGFIDEANNVLDEQICVFYVLHRVNDIGDFDAKEAAMKACKRVKNSILARMRLDAKTWVTNENDLRGFNMNTVRYYSVGPLASGFYGIRVSFTLATQATEIAEDADNWAE